MSEKSLRVLLVVFGVFNVGPGIWAMVAPQHWFDEFPGWSPYVVAAYPPYNEHLSFDAGAALFASGALLLIAAAWPRRDILLVALTGYACFTVPHAIYHVVQRAEPLTDRENVTSVAGPLVISALVGLFLIVVAIRHDNISRPDPTAKQPSRPR
ncbi:MAG: hypothetical protein HKN26_03035 [Acidimicrobiales bacterium]|nr:hypothetical protein [Acidimicrobiales bacterium]